MSKVLVLGSSGQLASELRILAGDDKRFLFAPKEQLEISNPSKIQDLLQTVNPAFVVNCTAYTAVDRAQSDQSACFQLNRDFVRTLAQNSFEMNFHLIHFSTDYVFDGASAVPYRETDPSNPINTYGESKRAGEEAVLQYASSASIIRTSWVYSKFGSNFIKTVLRLSETSKPLRIVNDQIGCPTWTRDLAHLTIERLLEKTGKVDIFHYSSEERCSWFEFAQSILQLWQRPATVEPISSAEFRTPAARPRFSVLDKSAIKSAYSLSIKPWHDSLEECRAEWET